MDASDIVISRGVKRASDVEDLGCQLESNVTEELEEL